MTRLPPEISAWLGDVLGENEPIQVRRMHGSSLPSVFSLTTAAGPPLVLRWFSNLPGPFTEEEDPAVLVRREALALSMLASSELAQTVI